MFYILILEFGFSCGITLLNGGKESYKLPSNLLSSDWSNTRYVFIFRIKMILLEYAFKSLFLYFDQYIDILLLENQPYIQQL
jgi:hypothetical protein